MFKNLTMFENFNEFIIFIFIFLIILFFYLHIQYQLKTSSELEVYERDQELSKERLEEICNLRQPILLDTTEELIQLIEIFNKDYLSHEFSLYDVKIRNKKNIKTINDVSTPLQIGIAINLFKKDAHANYYSENNLDFLNESNLAKKIRMNDNILKPIMTCDYNYDFIFGANNASTPLKYEINYRNYILSTGENIKIRLIPPKYVNYFNIECDYERLEFISDANIWNIQPKYEMAMKKVKYIDVDLPTGKILFIPAYWMYSINLEENGSALLFTYKTWMNIVSTSPILLKCFLQRQNTQTNYLKKITSNDEIAIANANTNIDTKKDPNILNDNTTDDEITKINEEENMMIEKIMKETLESTPIDDLQPNENL